MSDTPAEPLPAERVAEILGAARLALPKDARLTVTGRDPVLGTSLAVGEVAATALGLVGCAAADLHALRTGTTQQVTVDTQAAATTLLGFLFQSSDQGFDLRRHENPVTAIFRTRDERTIHLHGGFAHLEQGMLDLLGCGRDGVAAAVARWDAQELEDAAAERGLCAARVRSRDEWLAHPHGRALEPLPAVVVERIGDAPPETPPSGDDRPLAGVRALDLTRVLAGPTCGRTLAEHGARVLRVGASKLPSIEPFVADTGRGKRNAFLDLDRPDDVASLRELVGQADVFTQGYRPGRLSRRGFGPDELAALRPGIVYVTIDCYGPGGPFTGRAGWEQLAQSTSGMAHLHGGEATPALVPAAATDYTTGYLAAYGVIAALAERARSGGSWHVRASLCQTAGWILRMGGSLEGDAAIGVGDVATRMQTCEGAWGRLSHLAPVTQMSETPPRWDVAPSPLGSHPPSFEA